MTTRNNSFEGGTNGTDLTQGSGGNSGGTSGDYFNVINATAGHVQWNAVNALVGSMGVACINDASTSTSQYMRWSFSATPWSEAWMRAYVKVPALPGGNRIILRSQLAAVTRCSARVTSTGTIQLTDSGGSARYTSSHAFSAGDSFRVELHFQPDATNGHMEARLFWGANINGATADETLGNLTDNWNLGGTTEEYFDFGNITNSTGETRYFDAVALSDVGWIGPAGGITQALPVTVTMTPALKRSRPKTLGPGMPTTAALVATKIPAGSSWFENAEGGSDEAVVTTGTTGFDQVIISGGSTFVHDTANHIEGSKSFRVNLAAGANDAAGRKTIVGAPLTTYYREHLLYTSATVTNSPCLVWRLTDPSGVQIASITVSAARHVITRDANDTVVATSDPYIVPTNTWVRLEVKVVCDSVAGSIEVRVYNNAFGGTADLTMLASAVNTGDTGAGFVYYGRTRSWSASLSYGPYWMDAVAYGTTTWIGPVTPPAGTTTGAIVTGLRPITTHADVTTSGTNVTPDGRYYVRIIAKDDDGSAPPAPLPPALGVPGSVVQVTHDDIAVDAIWANNILAGQITAEKLEAVLVLASKMVTALTGQRIEIGTDGIVAYNSLGVRTLFVDSQTGNAEFQGRVLSGDGNTFFSNSSGLSHCRVSKAIGSAQSIPYDNQTNVTFATVVVDTGGYFNKPVSNIRFTLPFDGMYLLIARLAFDQATGGYRELTFQYSKDAGSSWTTVQGGAERKDAVTGANSSVNHVVDYTGVTGDMLRVQTYQNRGATGALDLVSASMAIIYLGPG